MCLMLQEKDEKSRTEQNIRTRAVSPPIAESYYAFAGPPGETSISDAVL